MSLSLGITYFQMNFFLAITESILHLFCKDAFRSPGDEGRHLQPFGLRGCPLEGSPGKEADGRPGDSHKEEVRLLSVFLGLASSQQGNEWLHSKIWGKGSLQENQDSSSRWRKRAWRRASQLPWFQGKLKKVHGT